MNEPLLTVPTEPEAPPLLAIDVQACINLADEIGNIAANGAHVNLGACWRTFAGDLRRLAGGTPLISRTVLPGSPIQHPEVQMEQSELGEAVAFHVRVPAMEFSAEVDRTLPDPEARAMSAVGFDLAFIAENFRKEAARLFAKGAKK